ncbi:MAG: hypothetical protein ACOX6L_07505 [Syntrophomonadaceae bacterium]|jgi:hypothetical protein
MITFNHDLLFDLVKNKISIEQFAIGTVRIGATIDAINITEINDIYVSGLENQSDYTISERLGKLCYNNGWVHFAGGLSCDIKSQTIDGLKIRKRYIEKINHFTREDIIGFHGKPDYELIDYWPWGLNIDVENYILSYNSKKLHFYIDPKTNKLTEIRTGLLNKKEYESRV